MNRRELLQRSAALSVAAAVPFAAAATPASASAAGTPAAAGNTASDSGREAAQLRAPDHGSIPVAFVISEGAVVIDFCGPWEVFSNVNVPGRDETPFQLYTVAEAARPVTASGGLTIVPN